MPIDALNAIPHKAHPPATKTNITPPPIATIEWPVQPGPRAWPKLAAKAVGPPPTKTAPARAPDTVEVVINQAGAKAKAVVVNEARGPDGGVIRLYHVPKTPPPTNVPAVPAKAAAP